MGSDGTNRTGAGRTQGGRTQGGRTRLAQCEPSATQSASPRAVRAQRDIIHLSSIRASPPGAMRAQVTSPKRLPQGRGTRGRRAGSRAAPGSPEEGRAGDGATGTTADDRVRTRPAPGGDPSVGAVRDPDDGACGVRVRSGWTLDEENRNRSRAPHALPLCPAGALESTILGRVG